MESMHISSSDDRTGFRGDNKNITFIKSYKGHNIEDVYDRLSLECKTTNILDDLICGTVMMNKINLDLLLYLED